MSNAPVANRMISSNRNIRQSSIIKYSKHKTLNWEKWSELTCLFSSFVDVHKKQRYQLELHDRSNLSDPNGKIIDLQELRSLTYIHGKPEKNDPRDIIILDIAGRRHRLGFDDSNAYNQWKSLLDGVYRSSTANVERDESNNNATMNLLYESSDAMRYPVRLADQTTEQLLKLPDEEYVLVFDNEKVIIERNQDKQYTFVRKAVRHFRLKNENEIEIECGSRAAVQGILTFRFQTTIDAQSCYQQWSDGLAEGHMPQKLPRSSAIAPVSSKDEDDDDIKPPPRLPKRDFSRASTVDTPEPPPPPRKVNAKSIYYNHSLPTNTESSAMITDDYGPFQPRIYDTSL